MWCVLYIGVLFQFFQLPCMDVVKCNACQTRARRRTKHGGDITWYCNSLSVYRWKTDLNSFLHRKLEETTETSSYYVDENHSAGSEIQRPQYGRRSWRGSEPSTLEIDVYVWRYVLLVVLARNDDDECHELMNIAGCCMSEWRCIHWEAGMYWWWCFGWDDVRWLWNRGNIIRWCCGMRCIGCYRDDDNRQAD